MSMIHFYPVHQNAVFVLNVKMPFMSLFMSPLKLLFLNDGRTCFAKFKIYKGICNFIPNISFWESSFVYTWENSYFSDTDFKSFLQILKILFTFVLNILMNIISYVCMENLENQYAIHCPSEGKPLSSHFTSTLYLDEKKRERQRGRLPYVTYL